MPVTVGSTVTVEWIPGWTADGHSVTLTLTNPDGTTTSPTVTESQTTPGTFTATVDAAFPGRYLLTWTDTNVDAVATDVFNVWPADPRYLISVDDAATGLKWGAGDRDTNLEALALYVATATEVIEDIVGAVLIRTVIQPADGGKSGIALWERPSSITSVTVDGVANTEYVPNLNAGIVYADGGRGRFPEGRQNIVVTYRTGAASVPPSIQLAARELIRHLWQIGQQAPSAGAQPAYVPNPKQMGLTPSGFAVPNRVIELCANHYALPGTA